MDETSKSTIRRLHDSRYANTYFKGNGIDIGAGDDSLGKYKNQFPLITSIKAWDLEDGDAQYMSSVKDETYDFVHSSHCLEHLVDPIISFSNWIRICKPGGHIVTCIPDEDIYEQGVFPSTFNTDHKTSWTIAKEKSWSSASINVFDLLNQFKSQIEILKVELINSSFIYNEQRYDQTRYGISECAIEFIVRKRPLIEINRLGRYPTS
jgi:SAM-dependent methyltransferase